jgi:fused signal recognition particle receptor
MFFKKLKETLAATTKVLTGRLRALVKGRKIDAALWEEVEEILLTSDVGIEATTELLDSARAAHRNGEILTGDDLVPWLRAEMTRRLAPDERDLRWNPSGTTVVLIAGVNGCGKTTSIAKLCKHLRDRKKTVMLAACDTFRAAAVEQLGIWAERLGVEFVRGPAGSDPASVAFDAADRAATAGVDVLIIDTAGRLHTQKNLMDELSKITRVIGKRLPGAPHETLLVLDGTAGQNGLQQTRRFREHAQVTGLIVTKLDGTAKGGVVLSIRDQLALPVKFIGTGEQPEDFALFDEKAFTAALFGDE